MRGAKLFCKRPSASLPPPTKRNAEERKKFSFAAFARTIGGAKGDCAGCGNPAIRPRPAKFSAPFFESRTDCAATEIYSYKPRANLSKPLTIIQVSAAHLPARAGIFRASEAKDKKIHLPPADESKRKICPATTPVRKAFWRHWPFCSLSAQLCSCGLCRSLRPCQEPRTASRKRS